MGPFILTGLRGGADTIVIMHSLENSLNNAKHSAHSVTLTPPTGQEGEEPVLGSGGQGPHPLHTLAQGRARGPGSWRGQAWCTTPTITKGMNVQKILCWWKGVGAGSQPLWRPVPRAWFIFYPI